MTIERLRRLHVHARRMSVAWIAALLLAQALALVHGVVHPGGHGAVAAAGASVRADAGAPFDPWADHDDGGAQCRLVDQLALGHALACTSAAPPAPAAAQVHAPLPRLPLHAQAAARAHRARAPPRATS